MNDAKVDAKSIFLDALECRGAEELRHYLDQGVDPMPSCVPVSRS